MHNSITVATCSSFCCNWSFSTTFSACAFCSCFFRDISSLISSHLGDSSMMIRLRGEFFFLSLILVSSGIPRGLPFSFCAQRSRGGSYLFVVRGCDAGLWVYVSPTFYSLYEFYGHLLFFSLALCLSLFFFWFFLFSAGSTPGFFFLFFLFIVLLLLIQELCASISPIPLKIFNSLILMRRHLLLLDDSAKFGVPI